jgi:pilus assembly protein CpaB
MRPQNGDSASKVILQNVKVLAVGQQLEIEEKSRGKALPVTVATLLVTPEQSEKLALAATQGKLLLTLRSWTDDSQVTTAGVNPATLIEGSGRTAPVVADDAHKSRSEERRRSSRREEKVAAVPSAPASQHVEILRGDRFEERKFEAKEKP